MNRCFHKLPLLTALRISRLQHPHGLCLSYWLVVSADSVLNG